MQPFTLKECPSEYEISFKVNDTKDSSSPLEAIAGEELMRYRVLATTVKFNGDTIIADIGWNNPLDKIVYGEQIVDAHLIIIDYNTYLPELIPIKIKIIGTDEIVVPVINDDIRQSEPDNSTQQKYFSTTLTSTSLLLETSASYDINLIDREDGATYEWSSSDTKIATVNKKGVVKGLKNGQAKITCKVTTVDDKVYELNSNVTVDNISEIEDVTTLSDSELELTVNDTFDIDVENKLTKAKVKFVSLDKSVAKVTSVGGIVTALKKGNTKIQCTITNPNKEVIVLLCDVVVE
jgi:hypothetical protein